MKTDKTMTCRRFSELLDELLAGTLSDASRPSMEEHAAACDSCATTLRDAQRALDAVTPHIDIALPEGFRERLVEAARRRLAEQGGEPGQAASAISGPAAAADRNKAAAPGQPRHRRPARRIIRLLSGAMAAAVLVIAALTLGLNTPARAARNNFAQAVVAMEGVRSIRIELRIRTDEDEHFDYTNPLDEPVPHTLEAIYTPQLLWRIEKPGRKALYDGRHTYLWFDALAEGEILPYSPGVAGMLYLLIDPGQLLSFEEQLTRSHDGSRYTLHREGDTLRLTVHSPAQGDFSQSGYMRNASVAESDTRREYRFDAASGRLLGGSITFLSADGRERTLLEIDRIEYDAPLDAATLTALPEGITWRDQTQTEATASRLAGIDAGRAARLILDAFATWDSAILDEALSAYGARGRQLLRNRYAGATVVECSAPVRSGNYPGLFIPCRLRMADGTTEKLHLALRNDNAQQRWVVDGGL
ncbi:anti-sigma factor [uncultured Alistipes sp.]|uniref:anti-sigma factor family protein n=1 Tax=uncultured Alistipes sp. TaxID=538949 RepID=UPI0026DF9AFA|nr:zf-HC2 domain-containing protein [uncultured Alistipes sp.]